MDTYFLSTFQQVPPGGYICEIPENGQTFGGQDFEAVVSQVEIYIRANNFAGDARLMVDTQTATRLAKRSDFRYVRTESTSFHRKLAQYLSGAMGWVRMKALIAAGQQAFVSQEIAVANATICRDCRWNKFPMNQKKAMQETDAMMKDLTSETGGLPEEFDGQLGNCFACTCSIPALVWLNPTVVVESMTAKETTCLKSQIPKCWKLIYLREWEKRTGKSKPAYTGG